MPNHELYYSGKNVLLYQEPLCASFHLIFCPHCSLCFLDAELLVIIIRCILKRNSRWQTCSLSKFKESAWDSVGPGEQKLGKKSETAHLPPTQIKNSY